MIIDTHCHLTHADFAADLEATLERARAAGVAGCITIGTGLADGGAARALAEQHPDLVWYAAGIDPFTAHELGGGFAAELARLPALLDHPRCRALGEVGLDYYYDLDPKAVQIAHLERQLELALELDLPVVLHVRDAHADLAAVLGRHPRARGVVHSFTGGWAEAEPYLELGFHLAFNGIVTFRNADPLRQAAARVPADRLLLETDSPYLAPAPRRGRRAEPAFLVHTLGRLAEVRGEEPGALAARTTANARRLFRLEPDAAG